MNFSSFPNYAKVAILLGLLLALSSAGEPYASLGLYSLLALGIGVGIEYYSHKSLSWT